ncbi:hypothetical protein EON77_08765 [bacterium]|nr:MAG: hypothetical protein EON77_08765 [bacterium]
MAIPWVQILRWTPQIVSVSRDLLHRSRRVERQSKEVTHVEDRSELQERLDALESHERQQAELIEQMAEQQSALVKAVETLHDRQRLFAVLIGVSSTLAVVACAAVAWIALR